LLPPPVIAGYEAPMGAVPGLGQHADKVLGELGLSAAQLAQLRIDGVIGPAY
jgi:itaconate CoA-transferase